MRRFVLVLVVIAGVAACKKDENQPAAPAGAPVAGTPAPGSPEAAAAAAGAAAGAAGAATGAAAADTAAAAAIAAQNAAAAAQGAAAAAQGAAAAAAGMAAALPRPATITDAHVAAADKMFAAFEKASAALSTAGKDCAKAAAALKGLEGDFDGARKAFDSIKLKITDPAAEQWIAVTYGPRMQTAIMPFMAAAATCASNAEFAAVSGKFDLGGDDDDGDSKDK